MICPHCGEYRKLPAAMIGRVMKDSEMGGKCPACGRTYVITRSNMFDGDPEEAPVMCNKCGQYPAERGLMVCTKCHAVVLRRNAIRQRREKVERERNKRVVHKPKESLDEVAVKAQKMGLSYGRYVMLRSLGKIKED